MSTPTSQGASVSWGGTPIGYLTNVRASPATAIFEDATNVTSTVLGTGNKARIVRQWHCVAVEPGTVEVDLYGVPNYAIADTGDRRSLAVAFDDGSFTADAYLESFNASASVGQFLVGTARFRLA